jgi:hypothetical protein
VEFDLYARNRGDACCSLVPIKGFVKFIHTKLAIQSIVCCSVVDEQNWELNSLHQNTGISNNSGTEIILHVHWNLVGIVRLIGLKPIE